jgi:hypothetical protein
MLGILPSLTRHAPERQSDLKCYLKNQLSLICCQHNIVKLIHMYISWQRTCCYLLAYKTWQQYIK